jgi:hypothetical protein
MFAAVFFAPLTGFVYADVAIGSIEWRSAFHASSRSKAAFAAGVAS